MTTQTPDAVREALTSFRDQFAFYAREHTAAGKSEKAATNARFAKIADDALAALDSRAGDAGEGLAVAADSLLTAYRQKYARERGGIRENAPFRAEFAALGLALNDHRLGFPSSPSATPASAVDANKNTVAFVQEWLMSGDYPADTWTREFAAAIDVRCKPAVDAVPAGEGLVLVPAELTREMSDAGRDATGGYPYAPTDIPKLGYMQVNIIWKAILAAALSHGEGRK